MGYRSRWWKAEVKTHTLHAVSKKGYVTLWLHIPESTRHFFFIWRKNWCGYEFKSWGGARHGRGARDGREAALKLRWGEEWSWGYTHVEVGWGMVVRLHSCWGGVRNGREATLKLRWGEEWSWGYTHVEVGWGCTHWSLASTWLQSADGWEAGNLSRVPLSRPNSSWTPGMLASLNASATDVSRFSSKLVVLQLWQQACGLLCVCVYVCVCVCVCVCV